MPKPLPDFLSHLPVITLSKRELLQLLLKLEREEDSTCAIVRLGEDSETQYIIQAISDEQAYKGKGKPFMHPKELAKIEEIELNISQRFAESS